MDRTIQPEIQALKKFHILPPVRTTLPNGIPLAIVNAGEQEVVHVFLSIVYLNKVLKKQR